MGIAGGAPACLCSREGHPPALHHDSVSSLNFADVMGFGDWQILTTPEAVQSPPADGQVVRGLWSDWKPVGMCCSGCFRFPVSTSLPGDHGSVVSLAVHLLVSLRLSTPAICFIRRRGKPAVVCSSTRSSFCGAGGMLMSVYKMCSVVLVFLFRWTPLSERKVLGNGHSDVGRPTWA